MAQKKGLEEGDPIWVESLMTPEEWKERFKKYPTSTVAEPPQMFECSFKWRHQMGKQLTTEEINALNKAYKEMVKALIKFNKQSN